MKLKPFLLVVHLTRPIILLTNTTWSKKQNYITYTKNKIQDFCLL